jgi:RNA polymerase sigma factor (sigma-70 family)
MASQTSRVFQHLRTAVLRHEGAGLSDGQLLECYVNRREEAAFAALVRRHGPMVMGVCRRVLGNPHDAEDAFQATFLVLVRKAASVVPREMVANWLHGVARKTALRAKVLAVKRAVRERQVTTMPEPPGVQPNDLWHDLRPLLDQELGRLPAKYRAPVILCDLECKSIKAAARHLGWPQGTLAGRLARARTMLAKRLTRRGVTVSGGSLGMVLSQRASAGVPAAVACSTIKAASSLAAGQAVAEAVASATVAALTEGVLKTMLLTRLKAVTVVLMIAAIAAGAGLRYPTQAAEPVRETPRPAGSRAGPKGPRSAERAEAASSEPISRSVLSSSPMPRQAIVGLEKGRLVVRTLAVVYVQKTVRFRGKAYTSHQKEETLRTMSYELGMVRVYGVRGKGVNKKRLPELLKKEIVALVSSDRRAADPLNLRLFKEGTLLFITPAPASFSPVPVPPPGPPPPTFAPPPPVGDMPIAPPAVGPVPPPTPPSSEKGNDP